MSNEKNYKLLAVILGIIALVFAVLFFTKGGNTISDSLEDASDDLAECEQKIATWQAEHGTENISAEAQVELEGILEDCGENVEDAEEQI